MMTMEVSYQKYPAVEVINGCKHYGKGIVLDNLNMRVPSGSTYALLGSSGCGKTTLLSSIVGLKKLSSGSVQIFGQNATIKDKTLVGYMPQESGLHAELTISEELHFFGRLYGMDWPHVEDRIRFLVDLLHLPGEDCLIKNLSGGETRRVSLAVALLHKPRLLILDEATVGVDPLLRQSIWEHLYNLVREEGATIICSTHYTEEARHADVVSVMRHGRLLVEDNPSTLLDKFCSKFLEDVVLRLCHSQELKQVTNKNDMNSWDNNNIYQDQEWDGGSIRNISYKRRSSRDDYVVHVSQHDGSEKYDLNKIPPYRKIKTQGSRHLQTIYAMLILNIIKFTRFPSFIILMILFPATECIIAWAIHKPEPRPSIGYVNMEQSNCFNLPFSEKPMLGCELINFFVQDHKLEMESFPSETLALDAVHEGRNLGYLVIKQNFSTDSAQRLAFGRFATQEALNGSSIPLHLDLSHFVRNLFVLNGLYSGYDGFAEKKFTEAASRRNDSIEDDQEPILSISSLKSYKINEKLSKFLPVETNWYDKAAIMFIPVVIMVMPSVTGVFIILDKKRGVLQRTMLGGGNLAHLLIASILSYGLIYVFQMGIVIGAMKYIQIPFLGLWRDIYILNYAQSMIGLILGLLLGFVFQQELEAIFLILGFMIICNLTGGGLQTLDSLDYWTRWYVISIPAKLPLTAMENILFRGWTLANPAMLSCFVVQGSWIVSLLILTILAFNRIHV